MSENENTLKKFMEERFALRLEAKARKTSSDEWIKEAIGDYPLEAWVNNQPSVDLTDKVTDVYMADLIKKTKEAKAAMPEYAYAENSGKLLAYLLDHEVIKASHPKVWSDLPED